MNDRRTISWFSCGAASAVATKFYPLAQPVYCETGSEHPDNGRFMKDCEKWFGRSITLLRSDKYADTWGCWEDGQYLAGNAGAPCTLALKVQPRLAFQKPDDIHVFGYTADAADINRAGRLKANYPELTVQLPLIERGLTKAACLDLLVRAGLKPPAPYALGFSTSNCLPCVKDSPKARHPLIQQAKELANLADIIAQGKKR